MPLGTKKGVFTEAFAVSKSLNIFDKFLRHLLLGVVVVLFEYCGYNVLPALKIALKECLVADCSYG